MTCHGVVVPVVCNLWYMPVNASQYDACVNSNLHTHIISLTDVIKVVIHLKGEKYYDDGILMSNNFLHGTHLLHVYTCIA